MEQQRIREALSLDVFFQSLLQVAGSIESDEDDEDEEECLNAYLSTQRRIPSFCFAEVDKSRQWIKDVLLEDSSESEEEDINEILKLHQATLHHREQFSSDPMLSRFMYYSSDLITGKNKWPAHRLAVKKKCLKRKRKSKQSSPQDHQTPTNTSAAVAVRNFSHFNGKMLGDGVKKRTLSLSRKRTTSAAAVRKHVWKIIVKKEIPKAYRHHMQNQSTKLALLKKASKDASKKVRANAHDSRFRAKKETIIGRARRMTREAQLFWKKYVRVEKTQRKHAERQALVQQRIDDEMRETLKQQQKLKFLITQTELYAHFVSGSLSSQEASKVTMPKESAAEDPMKEEILSHLDHTTHSNEMPDNDYTRERALGNANTAFQRHKSKMDMFSNAESLFKDQMSDVNQNAAQPKMLEGQLTGYQLTGVNWIFNLYLHGLNGILADDMGLGKTVQTIAFLAGLAERYDVWGPFLVIAPASTLNNWHQEFSRFLPAFKILPYWGSTSERKVLRLFWNQKGGVKPDTSSPFHVLITSYQLATTDVRYFQRIQWHYIVFDEAHALKSSNSIRWRTLLDFNCRNRLLLTGTPIQNTMAELWALLHFIMPTLFDNHAEFNEWFSKNIENYIESKSSIDQNDLSRLHMILKPFILRRLKCDVEHELTEKVEVRVLCQLSPRQKILYDALQRNVLIKELLRQNSTGQSTNNIVLMNLVMQFRKVCNHPDIFHSRDISSPYCFKAPPYFLPRLIYDSFFSPTSRKRNSYKFFYSDLNIHTPCNVQKSLAESSHRASSFSFLPFINLSPGEYWKVFVGNIEERCQQIAKIAEGRRKRMHFLLFWNVQSAHCHLRTRQSFTRHQHIEKINRSDGNPRLHFLLSTFLDLYKYSSHQLSALSPLLFVERFSNVIGHFNHTITCVSETKNVMTCHIKPTNDEQRLSDVTALTTTIKKSPVGSNRHRITVAVKPNEVTEIASTFKSLYFPKAFSTPQEIYCNDRSALHQFTREGRYLKKFVQFDRNICFAIPIFVPDRERLVSDSGKLQALDMLLRRLKDGGHRVLIYSQMTKMIDILEEYMLMRRHMYVRLDGSSRISSRRDTVAGFQSCENIFAFLLSTRAGGLGINLTAADTVIFYDSDWNPTVDQQAMDRAHRLGQTKQVTVYRLVCKGTVDERMLARAEAKSVIQRMVIQDGYFKTDSLNQKEMVSLLLDDDQIVKAAQKDIDLKNTSETAKLAGKRKYRRNFNKEGRGRKKVKKQGNISTTDLKALKLTPQVINISSNSNSAGSGASSSANTSDSKNSQSVDEQVIVVDDSNSEPVPSESTVVRGRRKRGRPRIRPIIEGRSRLLSRTPIQRRWPGVSRRGRGARAGRRGRAFSGRAAAMAGARAGAMAASVATFLSHADMSSNNNT